MTTTRQFPGNLRGKQGGLYIVEFAIVGLAALTILIGALEVCRMIFVVNTLEEATRRGARVAAVCTINNAAIAEATIFAPGGGVSPILPNLTTANVQVEYLSATGGGLGSPGGADYLDIEFVRVEIINYEHQFIIPGFNVLIEAQGHPTTIPSESLGVTKTSVMTC